MDVFDLSQCRVAEYETFYVSNFITQDEEQYLLRKINESPKQKWKQLANRRLQVWGGEITPKNILFAQAMPPFLSVYPDIITRLKQTGAFSMSPHGAPNHVILNEYRRGQGIMPHKDGPAYFPVVATLSLGSHSMFHYYQYKQEINHSPGETVESSTEQNGRVIDSKPVLTVFLEPRSLVISTGQMYTSHLHGIQEISEDCIFRDDINKPPTLADLNVPISNWNMLQEQEFQKVMQEGGVLSRGVRFSLTCRDVERVSNTKPFVRR